MNPQFANAGTKRWLQVAVAKAPEVLDEALRCSDAIDSDDSVNWKSPLASEQFREYRDGKALRCLGVNHLPKRSLAEFWPRRGPVWDALGKTQNGRLIMILSFYATTGEIGCTRNASSNEQRKTDGK
jgi:hypothetical protein